ncbi:uncharacterized isoform X2 [Zea mays]|uniref:Transport protein particle (TRAPP) component n=4 Tax=Zea mays TaxID=4577 RepID=A0A1D6DUL4_MAIZE|nr:uncharacterized protein LOC100193521 isoform X2 [Zea mays]ONM12508.1 Transport protein particle (TRAPP) component [Zea mays]
MAQLLPLNQACCSLCTGAAGARVEARADVAGARGRRCTGLSLITTTQRAYPLPSGSPPSIYSHGHTASTRAARRPQASVPPAREGIRAGSWVASHRLTMPPAPKSGDALFASVDRVNAELFTLTYGAIVRQLLTDLEEVEEVNKQLDQMGYNIGTRLVDEFLAKSNVSRCVDFKETADVIAKLGFKMFLGVTATVTNWDAEGTSCSLVLEDNPLVDFVELPDTCQGLQYCNLLSGVIRGALEMVSMKAEVTWVRDMLRGDDAYEMRVKLIKQVPEEYPYKDDD